MLPFYFEAQRVEFTWQAQEVVSEVDHKPHLVVRISVTGGFFPHRASVPIMYIVQPTWTEEKKSWWRRSSA